MLTDQKVDLRYDIWPLGFNLIIDSHQNCVEFNANYIKQSIEVNYFVLADFRIKLVPILIRHIQTNHLLAQDNFLVFFISAD